MVRFDVHLHSRVDRANTYRSVFASDTGSSADAGVSNYTVEDMEELKAAGAFSASGAPGWK